MERASVLAQVDIHRAATHNKGVMNGIHAVVPPTMAKVIGTSIVPTRRPRASSYFHVAIPLY
jgi:hypothetical protein